MLDSTPLFDLVPRCPVSRCQVSRFQSPPLNVAWITGVETIKRQTMAAHVLVWLYGCKPVSAGLAYSCTPAIVSDTALLQLQLPLVALYKCYLCIYL